MSSTKSDLHLWITTVVAVIAVIPVLLETIDRITPSACPKQALKELTFEQPLNLERIVGWKSEVTLVGLGNASATLSVKQHKQDGVQSSMHADLNEPVEFAIHSLIGSQARITFELKSIRQADGQVDVCITK